MVLLAVPARNIKPGDYIFVLLQYSQVESVEREEETIIVSLVTRSGKVLTKYYDRQKLVIVRRAS